jgi:hypothetical protein
LSFDIRSAFAQNSHKRVGVNTSFSEPAMPEYKICYLDEDGDLTYKFSADCDNDQRAKILAHAMKVPSAKKLEVWSGGALIYARPSALLEQRVAG